MILCLTPNPALDRLLVAPGYRTHEVVRVRESAALAGGKGNNVARAIRTLSPHTPVMCAGFLGGAAGRLVADLAERDGFGAAWTWIEGETRTCTILVDPDSRHSTAVNEAGPTVGAADWARLQNDVVAQAARAECVSVSGSLPPGSPPQALAALLRNVRAAGPAVWVDTSGPALLEALSVSGLHLKVNAAEAGAVLGREVATIDTAMDAATSLRTLSRAAKVVITLGARGAVLVNEAGRWHVAPPAIIAVNTVASGDAFLGGLLCAALRKLDAPEALRWGAAAGAANAASSGGARFTLEGFHARLAEARVTAQR
jgi:1-phosphofructokinase family hexose kinase